jgi:hypothetical protein
MNRKFDILFVCILFLSACAAAHGVNNNIAMQSNAYQNLGYVQQEPWNGAQGLTMGDGFFYFAGSNDRKIGWRKLSDIHVIDATTLREVRVLKRCAPPHAAELDYNFEAGTIFACSGGKQAAVVWEINPVNGSCINKWNFRKVGYGEAALVTYLGNREIGLFTSAKNGREFSIAKIKLGKFGQYTILGEWQYTGKSNLGIPNGFDSYNNTIFYLADAGKTAKLPPHYIYALQLNEDQSIQANTRYFISIGEETEGLCIDPAGGKTYFGTAEEEIFAFDADRITALIPYGTDG